ncbi:lipase family protein [Candidatus Jidaibacter acanthamoebae]|nr:hypothetical protein [Candidatus Jidaibacter acanthamoeba]
MNNYQLAQFSAAAYTKNSSKYENGEWKKLLTSDEVSASKSGFYGTAYINETSKEVVIANSGTNFNVFGLGWLSKFDFSVPIDFVKDLYSDTQLFFGYVPNQFTYGADKFTDAVIKQLGNEAHDYTFTTTGHSLGAVLSNLENAKLTSLGYQVSSVNIDSPGSKPILENYIQDNNLKLGCDNLDITTFNAPKHLANSVHDEVGNVYEFTMPYTNSSIFGSIMETIYNHQFRNIITKAFDKDSGDFIEYEMVNDELVYFVENNAGFEVA